MKIRKSFVSIIICMGLVMLVSTQGYAGTKTVTVSPGSSPAETFYSNAPGENHTLNIKGSGGWSIANSSITAKGPEDNLWVRNSKTQYVIVSDEAFTKMEITVHGTLKRSGGGGGGGGGAPPPSFDVTAIAKYFTIIFAAPTSEYIAKGQQVSVSVLIITADGNAASGKVAWGSSPSLGTFAPTPSDVVSGVATTELTVTAAAGTKGKITASASQIPIGSGQQSTGSKESQELNILGVDLSATDLYGTVTEANEENPGAYVHYNIDNDNGNTDGEGDPIADKDEDGAVKGITGENDLKKVTISLEPALEEGTVILKRSNTKLMVWKSSTKGATNKILVDSNEKTWALSNATQRANFNKVKDSLWVEGYQNNGTSNLTVEYKDSSDNLVHSDVVKYTFIGAICKDQPTPAQRTKFAGAFPNLIHCEWSLTHNETTNDYNCIAWSVGETNVWYNKLDDDPAQGVEGIDESYGDNDNVYREHAETFTDTNGNGVYNFTDTNGNGVHDPGEPGEPFVDGSGDGAVNGKYDVSDIDEFYRKKKGWKPVATGAADAEAMYYSGYHGAKKRGCNCGAGKWIMYESKCGGWERIEHVHDQLNGSGYGNPIKYYK